MRSFLFSLAAGLGLALVPLASAQVATVGEADTARTGGGYVQSAAANSAVCAQLCNRDGLCMAWDYQVSTQQCELKAVTPAPQRTTGFISGLSTRAPAFARAMSIPEPPAPSAPEPAIATTAPTPNSPPASHVGEGLLGGPEPAASDQLHGTS